MKYFACSVGKPDSDYVEDNLKRIIDRSGYVLHQDTKQKGTFDDIQLDDVLLLRYNEMFIAYGQVTKCVKTEDKNWNLWALVKKWYFFDKSNPRIGVSRYGIDDNTLTGSSYATVKTIKEKFALEKLSEIDSTSDLYVTIIKNTNRAIKNKMILEKLALLKYKKQIILQGPPGTGKTREAKLLADVLIRENLSTINFEDYFKINDKIANYSGVKDYYTILDVNKEAITLKNAVAKEQRRVTVNDVIENFEKATDTLTNQEYNSDFKFRYIAAVVSYLKTKGNFDFSNQCKIIQFHPSYTYEDFVRGIVAKPNEDGNGIFYEAENKVLGNFAKVALDNFLASKGFLADKSDFQMRFNILVDRINATINSGNTFKFGEKSTAEIISVGNNHLIYSFPDRKEIRYKLLFSDIEKVYNKKEEIKIPIDLRDKEAELELLMKGKYPYYFMILKLMEKIDLPENSKFDGIEIKEKPFVLIIDEINRANLSCVLGELIYALEYRGKEVESMYEVEGSQKLILPPNLYIIGTMNTADRSVGHIDYAIRRRFAFVDVLPEKLHDTDEIYFNMSGFEAVEKLFTTDTVSNEFEVKDVQIGHSYFIAKKEDATDEAKRDITFKMKMDYEIKPILREYLKDGIFKDGKQIDGKEIKTYIEDLA